MGKPLRIVALIAAAALMFVPGVGNAVGAFIIGSSAAAGGAALLGTIAVGAITAGLGIYGLGALRGAGASLSPFDPKSINADPAAPRKLLLGQTAFPVDLKYAEPSGTDQEFVDYIFALAAHKSTSIDTIYIENDLAWTAAGGAQGKYVGYLTVEVILEAGPGAYHTVNAGTTWGSTTRMTGSTTMKVRAKRSANSKNSQSPFSSGIAGRWAVIGTGIPVYDPARDSTVAGGSGSQRANDQTTWLYTASGVTRGNNPALQLLTYLLGWRIGGQISVGVGLPADTLDVASFAVAAALCDEPVALSIGGTQRRFETGRAFSDADDPLAVIGELLKGMNGELVDDGGRLALRVSVNDLVSPVALTDDDFVSGYAWQPTGPIDQQFTVVRGRYSEPTPTSLYSMVDYPEVAIPRTSLAPRPYTLELSVVQDQRRAERIAKQTAQRNLYQGTFNVTLGVRGWQLTRNQVVAVTSNVRGWTGKLFRVRAMTFNPDATIEVTLREEDVSIYAWDRNESAQVTPVPPVVFDSRNAASWLMADIAAGSTVGAVAGTNLFDSGGRTLTDGEISNTAQRVAVRQWAFNNQSLNGWSGVAQSGSAPTVTAGSQFVTYTANSTDTSWMSPDLLGVDGRIGRYLRMILSATATLSALMRNVEVYFSTNAYAPIDGTRSKNGDWIPANHPTNGTPFEVLLDMHSLTMGGNAWRDEIVRRVRIDFDGTVPETIRIHEISMVYLGTATVGAPPGTPVGAYADAASIAPAVATAGTTALWPNVTGTGRPADNATRNIVTYSATAPASPVDGDLWVDTSGTFAVFKLRSGGAWLTGANALTAYNGLTGRPVALADINTTESSKLAGIAPGADVTALNTAAAIAGQAWAATNGAQALVDNRLVAVGSNIVVNSEFTRGIYGFRFAANTGVGPLLTVNGGVNLSADWSGIKNVLWASVATGGANWNAAGEADPFSTRGNWNGGNMTEQRQFGLPVKNGDVVYARCLLARHRCNTRLYLLVFDKDGNYLPSTSTNWAGGRDGGAGGGNPANFDVVGGTQPITHANAATALMMWRMLSTSQADPYIFMAEPAMGVLPAGQTVMPPYQVGNSDPLADATRDTLPALQRGAWSASSVAYALGDIVTRDGSSYTCIIAHTSTGANGPPGANWSLLANAGANGATGATGAQGPTGVSAPPIKSLSTGAAQLDPIRLVNGQTVTAAAELYLNTGGVAGVCSLELQISVAGAGSWATMTSGTVTDSQPTSEPVELVITGATFTNSGADRLFDIRAVSTRQSRSVNVPPSFVRVL